MNKYYLNKTFDILKKYTFKKGRFSGNFTYFEFLTNFAKTNLHKGYTHAEEILAVSVLNRLIQLKIIEQISGGEVDNGLFMIDKKMVDYYSKFINR